MATPPQAVRSVLAALLAGSPLATTADTDSYAAKREALLHEIERDVRETAEYLNRRKLDDRVMAAMAVVPRHEFVRPEDRHAAYQNRPLPIGHGQTISQPYIVAVMTDLLEPKPGCRALGRDAVHDATARAGAQARGRPRHHATDAARCLRAAHGRA